MVFLEGSACHGAELLGAGMIRRGFLLPRRRGYEAAMFARIVASRSQDFGALDDCTEYLGSAIISKANGVEHAHHGATWLHLDRIVAAFRALGLAELRDASDADYRAAAAADLQRYLAFQARIGGRYDEAHARKLSDAFAQRVAAVPCAS